MGHALNRMCNADGLYGELAGSLLWRADGGRSCYPCSCTTPSPRGRPCIAVARADLAVVRARMGMGSWGSCRYGGGTVSTDSRVIPSRPPPLQPYLDLRRSRMMLNLEAGSRGVLPAELLLQPGRRARDDEVGRGRSVKGQAPLPGAPAAVVPPGCSPAAAIRGRSRGLTVASSCSYLCHLCCYSRYWSSSFF
jgi:hypothetical protein